MAYRSRSSYHSKTPGGRARQLANLKSNTGQGVSGGWRKRAIKAANLASDALYIDQYPDDVIGFIEHHFYVKETKAPIVLLPWQYDCLFDIFYSKIRPSLAVCGSVKKSGKSCLAAAVCLWFLTNVEMSESYILAPDLDAGKDVVFRSLKQAIRMHGILNEKCKITKDTITYGESFVKVLPCDISISGLRPNLTVVDEAWQFRTENSIRTLDEATTNPLQNHLTLCVTTAGYQEDQTDDLHLWRWYCRGKAIEEGKEPADPAFYFFWKEDYTGVPWVQNSNYLAHQRRILKLSTYQRFHENKWSSAISTFTIPEILDACIDPSLRMGEAEQDTRIVVGVDCGPKWDASALAAIAKDETRKRGVVLVEHRIFEGRGRTINFESTIEAALIEWGKRYRIVNCYYDPYQMLRSAQALKEHHIRMTEYPQTVPNMVSATQTLDELIHSQSLRLYPNSIIRQHILSASTKEHNVGLRLVKRGGAKKIDFAIALCMACEAAMKHFLLRGRKGRVYLPGESDAIPTCQEIEAKRRAERSSFDVEYHKEKIKQEQMAMTMV